MRGFLAALFALVTVAAEAQTEPRVVQTFEGHTSSTTPVFTVGDKWEVLWDCPAPVRITVLAADGTIVGGVAGMFRGSFYEPKGGSFYLQVNGAEEGAMPAWHLTVEEMADGDGSAAAEPGPQMNFVAPAVLPPTGGVPGGSGATNAASSPAPPTAPAPTPQPAPLTGLTEAQGRAIVLIEGDNAEGTGFLVKMPDGPAVVTNQHVLAGNPHVRILTNTGAEIATVGLKGASDRDLALLPIKDDHYDYLDLDADVGGDVHPGDEVITPGDGEGGQVVLDTHGSVVAVGPDRVEVSNPIYHGNSGGPVFDLKNGKVIAVVTQANKVDTSDALDKASFESHDSAITASMRYFGLRLDTVPKWETYDPVQFQDESAFLERFHEQSLRLDSYLNSSSRRDREAASRGDDEARPPATLYLLDDHIVKAHDDLVQQAEGGDASERLDAFRQWVFTMGNIADTDVPTIENFGSFYSYDQKRARQELAYRMALKNELDSFGDDVGRAERLGRTR